MGRPPPPPAARTVRSHATSAAMTTLSSPRPDPDSLRRARAEGVSLAARTLQHELNSRLTTAIGHIDLLLRDPALPLHVRHRAAQAAHSTRAIARVIAELLVIDERGELIVRDWSGHGTTIDVGDASATHGVRRHAA